MKLLGNKKGFDVSGKVTAIILSIIGIIVIFSILGATSTDLTSSADQVSASGLPLANLFSSNGIILLVFMAGILISLIVVFLKKK